MARPTWVTTPYGDVELVLTDDGASNIFTRGTRFGKKVEVRMKKYDVLLLGQKIGSVYQDTATFERKTPGRTYVNRRWRNVRWFFDMVDDPAYRLKYSPRRSSECETRRQAIEGMVYARKRYLSEAAELPEGAFADV